MTPHYEPELFERVPADSVVAVSFGGTQGVLDRIEGQVDVDGIAGALEKVTGVSLDGVLEALTGEGVLFVRPGEELPEVTLALRPPDARRDVDGGRPPDPRARRRRGATVTTDDRERRRRLACHRRGHDRPLGAPGAGTGRRDHGRTSPSSRREGRRSRRRTRSRRPPRTRARRAHEGLRVRRRRRPPAGRRAAAGTDVPPDLEQSLGAIDAVLLQASGDGDTTRVSGFVRVPD